ncbi:radical SAM protein [Candidatus Pacearchaeota archaeon]|nr:radical SAM protein [Candidatus Pacearchaeota archaeon]
MNKILFVFPNTANKPTITMAIPIFAGIAKNRGWQMYYFDTTYYEKRQDSIEDKEKTGGFLPVVEKQAKVRYSCEQLIFDLQNVINDIRPDVLCITAMSCDFEYLMTFLSKIQISKETLVAIGGVHSIFCPEEVINKGLFDLVCIGQGESVFEEILIKKENNEKLDNIEGTYYRDRQTEQIIKNKKKYLLSPDKLWRVDTDYSLYGDEYFIHPFDGKMVRMFWMEVSRGCPWSCEYCGNSALKQAYKGLGKYVCSRPLDSTFRNFKIAIEELKTDIFNFTSECFLAQPIKILKEFANRYAKEVRKPFLIQTRSETVTEERLEILKSFQAPFFQVGMGVESGSKRILNEICDRRADIDDIIRAYDLLNKYGIRSNAYFMVGLPTETREDIFSTVKLCRRINSHINSVSIFQPLPGAPLTNLCIEKGYITGKESLETFTSTSVLKMPQISSQEIGNLRKVFLLYAKLPEEYHKDIEKCEYDYENNRELFDKLIALRWQYDQKWKKEVIL